MEQPPLGFPPMSLSEDGPSGQSAASHVVRAAVWDALGALDHLRVALLRPVERLGDDGDIDLLVGTEQFDDAVAALHSAGFHRLDHGDPADGHLVAHDPASASFVWVHLQTRVRSHGVELDSATLLRTAMSERDVPVIAPEWLFWVLLVHTGVERGTVPERYREHLRSLAPDAERTVPDVRALLMRVGCDAEAVHAAIADGDWVAADRLTADVSRRVPLSERVSGRWVSIRRLRRRRGLAVAAIGPDGAGKTTLMASLEASLPVPTTRLYLGLTGGRLPSADRLRVPGVVFLARLGLLWTRQLVIVFARARGRVVLVDRHALDGRVPSGVPLGPLRRWGRRIESRIVPLPDLLFVLDAPGDVLHHRSGEYDPDTLEGWRSAYRRIAGRIDRAVVLDTTDPAADVLRNAQEQTWAALIDRAGRAGSA